jgi:hypothetical protein
MQYCIPFSDLTNVDVPRVGGKNASLGEMVRDPTPTDHSCRRMHSNRPSPLHSTRLMQQV